MPRVKLSPRHKVVMNKLNSEVHRVQCISHVVEYVFTHIKNETFVIRGTEKFSLSVKVVGLYRCKTNDKVLSKPKSLWVRCINKSIKLDGYRKSKYWLEFVSKGSFMCDVTRVVWDLK